MQTMRLLRKGSTVQGFRVSLILAVGNTSPKT
jgi:hypothetical protein